MKVPNAGRAVVGIEKLRDYCLNPAHPQGCHKARVFTSRLGVTAKDAEVLRRAALLAARTHPARPTFADIYGQRYVIDFQMAGPKGSGAVRSTWIVRTGEDFARLTSCYVL